jgi:hypothetical protein
VRTRGARRAPLLFTALFFAARAPLKNKPPPAMPHGDFSDLGAIMLIGGGVVQIFYQGAHPSTARTD